MDESRKPNAGQWDEIASYMEGAMSNEERVAFEQRLAEDASLRSGLQSWREAMDAAQQWVEAKAPGVERVEALAIPTMPRHPITLNRPSRLASWRKYAAAALFIIGFGLGMLTQKEISMVEPPRQLNHESNQTTIKQPSPIATPRVKPSHPSQPEVALHDEPTFTRQEDGKVIIETTLHDSGARATWIVDGSFQPVHQHN